jgi:hypothetical protein
LNPESGQPTMSTGGMNHKPVWGSSGLFFALGYL